MQAELEFLHTILISRSQDDMLRQVRERDAEVREVALKEAATKCKSISVNPCASQFSPSYGMGFMTGCNVCVTEIESLLTNLAPNGKA
jgi:hypothetical protein